MLRLTSLSIVGVCVVFGLSSLWPLPIDLQVPHFLVLVSVSYTLMYVDKYLLMYVCMYACTQDEKRCLL